MSYRPLDLSRVSDSKKLDVFRRADLYLGDCYSMLRVTPRKGTKDGACNFTIALALLCVIDGIAVDIYPTRTAGKQAARFKKLIEDKLHWEPADPRWIDKATAAKWLYEEFRNPLTHELGKDKRAKSRPADEHEPAVGKWGHPTRMAVDRLDARKRWRKDWPVMTWLDHDGGKRLSLCCAALYWTVKRMVADLAR